MKFEILSRSKQSLARRGRIETKHGSIETPAFITVGTKATVKSVTPELLKTIGTQAVLANTYHLYLEPGRETIKVAGGFPRFMNWAGPSFTDSGGFQVFSLGSAFERSVTKLGVAEERQSEKRGSNSGARLAKIDEDGVNFTSYLDGSMHRFTPESSIATQRDLGADIMFAFDECTAPDEPYEYQKEALDRTHRWAERSLDEFKKKGDHQNLFGIVQGARYEDLRMESARKIGGMDFDGFGIGGSFDKEDMGTAVRWVNEILPDEKPRHLLGIGEPGDIIEAVKNGCDTFDCVMPTRLGRTASLMTKGGRMNIENAQFKNDFTPVESGCDCPLCVNYTRAYLHHLFRAKEMLAATLASIHNLRFMERFMAEIRESMESGTFADKYK